MNEEPIPRPAARVILLDALDRIFLMHFNPRPGGRGVWITPGGGLDSGETYEEAALRELWEEVGLRDVELGPCVWLRSFVYPYNGRLFDQRERFYVCRVESHDVGDHLNHDEVERDMIKDQRWWQHDELTLSDQRFAPRDLAYLLPPVLAGNFPAEPFVVDSSTGLWSTPAAGT